MSFTSEQSKKQNCASTIQFPTFLFFFFFFKNCFTIWISYVEIKFDGCGEKKSFLLKDTFQGLKVKTGGGKKNHSRSWIMCWKGFNTSTGTSIHWLIDWFINYFIRASIHSPFHWFVYSIHRVIHQSIHLSVQLFIKWWYLSVFYPWFIYSFIHQYFFLLNVMLKNWFFRNTSLMILPCGPTW